MLRHPMRQQSDAPERQENRDSAQPRYGPGVDMPIGRWQTCQTMPDRIIADQSRENSREQKCGQKYNNLHGFSCSATSEDWNYWLAGQGGYGFRLALHFKTLTTLTIALGELWFVSVNKLRLLPPVREAL